MQFFNRKTLLQLRDAAYYVSTKTDKLAISTMFNTELKFAADVLLKWFNAKIKSKNLELDLTEKNIFQHENEIDWKKDKYCICNLLIDVKVKSLEYEERDVSYFDFLIRKEHAFLRNISSNEKLNRSPSIKYLESYYVIKSHNFYGK